ncbi:hypothetical protein V6N13_111060 [Hibiscus sabdariffa]|uniref:Uncharacterized protein n=1 Tax=Hibiscus sabdariffa TaxID=183260 RepID=A0ABR2TJ19_9ROSI
MSSGMATLEIVKILETTRVAPSTESPESSHDFSLPLTFFDTYWFKFPPVQTLYFYQLDDSTSTLCYFTSIIIPKLKQSLSLTLLHYLPLAGNLRWPSGNSKPVILYAPNDAVSFTAALSHVDNFHILSSNGIHKANELHPLVPQLISSDDKAEIISLQITLFPRQGFTIGITTNHAVIDGRTAVMFMRSWAHLCKQIDEDDVKSPCLPPELTPSFDRSCIKDQARLDMLFLNHWQAFNGEYQDPTKRSLRIFKEMEPVSDDIVRGTFIFTQEDIKKLREKALSKMDATNAKQLHLSSFVLTFAYTATCVVKSKGGDSQRQVFIDFGVDCRSRLNPPLPNTYCGDCVICFNKSAKARDFMEEDGFTFAVKTVSDLVNDIKKGVLEEAEKKMFHFFLPKLPGLQLIVATGSPRFNAYGADFGLGKIMKVEMVSIDKDEAISMAECRDGDGGIEISLALEMNQMRNFTSLFYDGLVHIN